MVHLIRRFAEYYRSGNRWWVPLAGGLLYSLALPPFNHEFGHGLGAAFALFPLLNFLVLLPLFAASLRRGVGAAFRHLFIFGFAASLGQFYWLIYDRVQGLWVLVIIGLFLIAATVSLFYCAAGLLFRLLARRIPPAATLVIFPALWVLIDYLRTRGDLAFPWSFLGYSFTPLLPLAQLASVTGVWGLTFAAVMGNVLIWNLLVSRVSGGDGRSQVRGIAIFAAVLAGIALAGWIRIERTHFAPADLGRFSLLQSDIDQFHWNDAMIDTSLSVSTEMMLQAAQARPDLMVLPESAILCFIRHEPLYAAPVRAVVQRTGIPLIFGALDWEKAAPGSYFPYLVFNSAFLAAPGRNGFSVYHKNHLVPFSESTPFQEIIPLLSRVNLGGAGFARGNENTVYPVSPMIKAAPLICYESLFPGYIRSRVRSGATVLINITNDGWFGRSSGPYQHAEMARMRAIEDGISTARCANSGISMLIDPLGRVIGRTGLYERTILTGSLPCRPLATPYVRFGDWFVWLSLLIGVAGVALAVLSGRSRDRT